MSTRSLLRTAFLLPAAALLAACASTPEAPKQVEITDEVVAQVRILDVDKSTRTLTLERSSGAPLVVTAGPEIRNFDQIQPGDSLTARYVVGLSARRLEPNEPDTPPSVGALVARARSGQRPGAAIGADVVMTVVIKTVDLNSNVVTFVTPSGSLEAVEAEREKGQRFIAGLKPGDRVELIYGEVLALGVK